MAKYNGKCTWWTSHPIPITFDDMGIKYSFAKRESEETLLTHTATADMIHCQQFHGIRLVAPMQLILRLRKLRDSKTVPYAYPPSFRNYLIWFSWLRVFVSNSPMIWNMINRNIRKMWLAVRQNPTELHSFYNRAIITDLPFKEQMKITVLTLIPVCIFAKQIEMIRWRESERERRRVHVIVNSTIWMQNAHKSNWIMKIDCYIQS